VLKDCLNRHRRVIFALDLVSHLWYKLIWKTKQKIYWSTERLTKKSNKQYKNWLLFLIHCITFMGGHSLIITQFGIFRNIIPAIQLWACLFGFSGSARQGDTFLLLYDTILNSKVSYFRTLEDQIWIGSC
jgi:hypothetical protein